MLSHRNGCSAARSPAVLRLGCCRRAREKWTPSFGSVGAGEGPREKPRFRAARRHPGSFDDRAVRAVDRRRASGRGTKPVLLRAAVRFAARQGCPLPIPSRPLAHHAEAWSGRGDRQSGSSTPNRVTGALPPAGLRWPGAGAHTSRAGKRAAPGCARSSRCCRSRRAVSGSLELPGGGKALRIVKRRHRSCGPAGSGSPGASEENRFAREVGAIRRLPRELGDPKRVKRHEARHSPSFGKPRTRQAT